MPDSLEFSPFIRKPFVVEAVQVTEDNIQQIAKYVGDIEEKTDGSPYIAVDRRIVPNIFRVYPGFWMTRMGDHIRCYSARVFAQQFTEQTEEIAGWVEYLNGGEEAEPEE
jgi:hypothetical protein